MSAPARSGGHLHRVLVDGGSGSGKTTLAARWAATWQRLAGRPVQVVHLDDIYPGWHGLAAAQEVLVRDVLRDEAPGYRRWDWAAGAPAEWVPLEADGLLLVEGCGALTPSSVALADLAVWLDVPADRRRERALGRPDGDGFEPWWEVWAAQEREHWRAHRPWELAHLVVGTEQLS